MAFNGHHRPGLYRGDHLENDGMVEQLKMGVWLFVTGTPLTLLAGWIIGAW